MSMLTRGILGALLVVALLFVAIGCQKQVAVQPESVFPGDRTSVPANDPTVKPSPVPKVENPPAPPKPEPKPESKPAATSKWQPPTQAEIDAAKKAGTVHAMITTAKGDIEVELYGSDTPLTVANFVKLVNAKFYDGLIFHRVLDDPGFSIIQGGDPNGDGTGGPGYQIKREIVPKLKHIAGALAMARSTDPDSAGSQFYICRGVIPHLDGEYAVFGKVVKGLDVAKKIKQNDKIVSIRMK